MEKEDVVFWVFFFLIIGIVLWVLLGSPETSEAALAVALLCQGQLLALWRTTSKLEVEMKYIRRDLKKIEKKIVDRLETSP